MTDSPADRTALEDIQDALLDRLHAGETIDRAEVLARHPVHADALRRFFQLLDVIEVPADPSAAPPGRLGEFEILRELGRGGMGVVYEARQVSLNRRVALKVLPPSLRRDHRLLVRFQREAEAAARLRHPNIVPVYSIGESAGAPFFAMELVEGRSLADVIRARRDGGAASLPTEPSLWRAWCVGVAARMADALDYAHGQGILHRDIKPANILLEADGTPRLTDFGLALDLTASELTQSGEVFGSPLYMSPEQAFRRDQPVDARTDIYSLAVTLYELLTLRLPYAGTSHAELMSALSTGRIVDPREADPAMPEPLARVLSQALRSDPRERYASAADFASDLRAALDEPGAVQAVVRRGTDARPVEPAAVAAAAAPARAPFRQRHPTLGHPVVGCGLLLLSGMVLLAIALSGFMLWGTTTDGWTPAPVQLGDRAIVSVPPTAAQLDGLAKGTLDNAQAVLSAWLQPSFETRGVVSRKDPGAVVFELSMAEPRIEAPNYVLDWTCALLVDGQVVPMPGAGGGVPVGAGNQDSSTWARSFPLESVLGAELERDTITLRPVVTMRVGWRSETGVSYVGGPQTTRTWNGPERTLFVYDDFPADYPELVSDPALDELMRDLLQPRTVRYDGGVGIPGARSLRLMLEFEPAPRGPVPLVMDVSLQATEGGETLGRAVLSTRPRDVLPEHETFSTTLEFELSEPPSDVEQRLLLELEAGARPSVLLRFRPSRAAALAEPAVDRYWAGSLDVQLPVEPRAPDAGN